MIPPKFPGELQNLGGGSLGPPDPAFPRSGERHCLRRAPAAHRAAREQPAPGECFGGVPRASGAQGGLTPARVTPQDGRVRVPPVLQPLVGREVLARPPAPLLRYIGPNQPGGGPSKMGGPP